MTNNPIEELRMLHHIVIGADRNKTDYDAIENVYETLKESITRQSGGTVAFITDGTWTVNSESGDYLIGPVEHDIALNFLVTLTYEEVFAGVWENIKVLIADVIKTHNLGCEHIHVAMSVVQAKHFNVLDAETTNDNQINNSNDNSSDDGQAVA